jgi:nucleotide-binding universal stress UspA family protein
MSIDASALDLGFKSVLMATDLSSASVNPLHHALAIARRFRANLYMAHVVPRDAHLMAGPEALELACEGASEEMQQLERDLIRDGSLDGLHREFIVQQGRVWAELEAIIQQKRVDLIVLGTHARRGLEKLLLGSVAEEVFRDADCPVLTVGPHSYREGRVDLTDEGRTYLFATDFGEASLRVLSHAVSLANRTKAKLILLHVIPTAAIPSIPGWYSTSELNSVRESLRVACLKELERLVPYDEQTSVEREFIVQFGIPSEKILQAALNNRVDLIILGLRQSSPVTTIPRLRWGTAYEIVCGAGCPVLTMR